MFTYETKGVCSKKITFEIEKGIVKDVKFYSGCPGNLLGISRLVEGLPAGEVVKKLKGIKCGDKSTSCPDQLARAIEEKMRKVR